jgi:hypothetical protein
MKTLKTILSKTSYLTLSLALGLFLAAGITFAAWATNQWHDTNDWVHTGQTISAQKIAENFEYLYSMITKFPTSCPNIGDVLIWNGTSFDCKVLNGDDPFLADNNHTSTDCESIGGTTYSTGYGYSICKISSTSCPAGWLKKDNWSSTQSNSCYGNLFNGGGCERGDNMWHPYGGTSCSVSGHGFANSPTEVCSYLINGCQGGYSSTCYATLIEVGCY